MEEKKYLSLDERKAQKKAEAKQRASEEKEAKKRERAEKRLQNKPERRRHRKKVVVFLAVLATLFCLSFTTTAFIIMSANKLTYDNGGNKELKDRIEELETLLEEKNEEIDKLTVELTNSSSSSFSAPVSSSQSSRKQSNSSTSVKQETKKTETKEESKKETSKTEESAKTESEKSETEEPKKEEPEINTEIPEENKAPSDSSEVLSELENLIKETP